MKKAKVEITTILMLAIGFGFFLTMYSWDGIVYFIESNNDRLPAKVTQLESFKNLKSKNIYSNYSNELITNMITIRTDESIHYKFKNFYLPSKFSVCSKYSMVKVQFSALNTSVNGETPYLEIEKKCTLDKNGYLTNIRFPKKMLSEMSLSEPVLKYKQQLIRLEKIHAPLPLKFKMTKVVFFNPREQASFASFKIPIKSKDPQLFIEY